VSAIHEAGDAVLHRALGGTIKFITIEASDGLQARAFMMRATDPIDWQDHLLVLAAGPIAESFVCRWQAYPDSIETYDPGATGDCARIATIVGAKDPDRADELYRIAFADAADMLGRPLTWRAVLDLAGRLLEARVMDGPDAHAILENHIAAGAFAGWRNNYGHQTTYRCCPSRSHH
jgi:hypothetical protein